MQPKLTIQERLKDLRVERGLTLEQLSAETGISRSALGKYEADDFKDISPFSMVELAKFYGVSTDYLLGLTEQKNHPNTELDALHLGDDAIDVLKTGKFNHRLLSELICHKDFQRLMLDAEIYVDRIADMRIKDMNTVLEATRQMVLMEHGEEASDLYLHTLKAAQILDTDAGENASEIMQRLSERYAAEQYSFVWEVFWLITGYMPPPLFDWKPNFGGKSLLKEPFELYAVCDDNLNDTLNGVYAHFIKEWDSPRISPELRLDIAKVRRTFADVKKTEDFRHELLGKINFWALNTENVKLECKIAEYCLQQYRKLSSDKESKLKNLQKYPRIMSYAMAEEAVKQLCADSYACVFRMLASLNQYLWPVT